VINLYRVANNELIGAISPADLQVLIDVLEEESQQDQDYYIDAPTIDLLAEGGASEALLNTLRLTLGSSEGVDIRWAERE
jgi:hypothetical protein